MFRLNLWAPFMQPPPVPSTESSQHLQNPLAASPALMVLAAREGGVHPFHASQGVTDKDLPAGLPFNSAFPMFRHGEHFPPPLYGPLHAPFVRGPGHSLGLINPGGGGAFRPVGSPEERENYHSAFLPAKRARLEDPGAPVAYGSPDSGKLSPECAQDFSHHNHHSGTKEDTLTTPNSSDIENLSETRSETGSVGSRTPDQGRRKHTFADGQPPCCPICNVQLRLGEIESHLAMELEKLCKIKRKEMQAAAADSYNQNPFSPSSSTRQRHTSSDVTSQSRYETYLRVRSNRHTRLNAKRGNRKKTKDESTYTIGSDKIVDVSSDDLTGTVDQFTKKLINDEDETVDVEGDDSQYNDAWRTQRRICSSSSQQDTCAGEAVTSTNDALHHTEDRSHNDVDTITSRDLVQSTNEMDATILRLKDRGGKKAEQLKCLICMETYTKPLASIQCWHVHCEKCWLRTLGVKKLCPECNMITSPSDLRKIYV